MSFFKFIEENNKKVLKQVIHLTLLYEKTILVILVLVADRGTRRVGGCTGGACGVSVSCRTFSSANIFFSVWLYRL